MKLILTTSRSLLKIPQLDLKHNLKQLEVWRDKMALKEFRQEFPPAAKDGDICQTSQGFYIYKEKAE